MAEPLSNPHHRLNALIDFSKKLIDHGADKPLVEAYKTELEAVTPFEAMEVLDRLLQNGYGHEQVKANVGKLINLFYKSLKSHVWPKPHSNHFLSLLMAENRAVESIMNTLKTDIKLLLVDKTPNTDAALQGIKRKLEQVKSYDLHYVKKENILFPYIEQTFEGYRCLQIMWSFHDDFRRSLKNLDAILASPAPNLQLLSQEMGKLFFVVFPLIFREEQIVFPVAIRAIPALRWNDMRKQADEIGWCYIAPGPYETTEGDTPPNDFLNGHIDLGTGSLTAQQLMLMLDTLPVDVTFIDEHDEVRYFSGAKHRIFPRAKAIIGRKVQNCHPHESVHVVNEIVEAFRNGSRDHADFWIQMKGLFIHIRYFALRDAQGRYRGTIEVSQDVTEIRALEGQRRLLEW